MVLFIRTMAIGAAYGSLPGHTTPIVPVAIAFYFVTHFRTRVPRLRSPKMVSERVDDVGRPGRFRVARIISGCETHADDPHYAFIQVRESYISRK